MRRFWRSLFKNTASTKAQAYPRSMLDLRGNDPCWCGSGKSYRRCHRPEDRRRQKDLGIHRRSKSLCDAFT